VNFLGTSGEEIPKALAEIGISLFYLCISLREIHISRFHLCIPLKEICISGKEIGRGEFGLG